MKKIYLFFVTVTLSVNFLSAQQILETGGKEMPDEWIDKDTHHKIIKLTSNDRSNLSFYFHNNPFAGDEMVFYSTNKVTPKTNTPETSSINSKDKQLFLINLKTLKVSRLSDHPVAMKGEIVSAKRKEAFFQVDDSIFSVNIETRKEKLIYVFPADFKGEITTINADGSLLGGVKSSDEEKEIFKKYPEKHDYFSKIFEARLPRTLFTLNIENKELNKIFTDSAWLNHVQFSPTNPSLLMFCHEGHWHKVDRIWTIDINSKKIKLIHKRTMPMEIAGHEWFAHDGKTIWFDLQQPRGSVFFVAGVDLVTGSEKKFELTRGQWSVHYTSSQDENLFAGDGGDSSSVAKAKDGKWIYLFTPDGNKFNEERLVNMIHHKYRLEPNVHFSPDRKWIIFRANFEGKENVYAVEVKKSN